MKDGCDTIGDLHAYFTDEMNRKKKNKPSISNSIRAFVLHYAEEVHDTKLAVFVLHNAYIQSTGYSIRKSYFEKIILGTWESEKDMDGVLHIDTSMPIHGSVYIRRIL
ncbi:MAG: hypothetical protein M0R80_09785 [Proteobacteria bacterium]|jgi:hypothetical protein|nr:hypothetical protein [Pseudomonadota bacterium]